MLFFFHELLTFFKAVALALNVDDSGMMEDTVEDGRSDGDVGEDLVPLRESLIRGKDC